MPPPSTNLGKTTLRGRCRVEDPLRAYDALPPPLRRWLAQAALPWSPASCRRIWGRRRALGDSVEAILDRLTRAERAALARAQRSSTSVSPSKPTRAKRRR